jgi:hypothetical protein
MCQELRVAPVASGPGASSTARVDGDVILSKRRLVEVQAERSQPLPNVQSNPARRLGILDLSSTASSETTRCSVLCHNNELAACASVTASRRFQV